jgi:translation initiation factor IF-2
VENQIFTEGYGGKIPAVNISAKLGEGVDELLEIVLLLAEMENLKANPEENASGFVIEAKLGSQRGVSATLLIQNGTMKKGMFVVSGNAIAPVRIFEDFQGRPLETATFSSPVRIIGFNKMPTVGEEFKTFNSKKEAEEEIKTLAVETKKTPSVEMKEKEEGKIIIPIIIKVDFMGSAEALEQEIKKLEREGVFINILRRDTGKITEDDIKFASSAKNPIVLGFNVELDSTAKILAKKFNITIFISDIIYKISEWLEEEIKKRKEGMEKEEIIGAAKIIKIFSKKKNKQLVGGRVISGKIISGEQFKIKREEREIGMGKIKELQHNKMPAKEIREGDEFGAMIESKIELAKDDEIIFCG